MKGGVQELHWDSGCGEGLQEVGLGAVAQKRLLGEGFWLFFVTYLFWNIPKLDLKWLLLTI